MMNNRKNKFEQGLREKLYDFEIHEDIPLWPAVESRIDTDLQTSEMEKKPLFLSVLRYAAVLLVLVGVGFGLYRLNSLHEDVQTLSLQNTDSQYEDPYISDDANTVTSTGEDIKTTHEKETLAVAQMRNLTSSGNKAEMYGTGIKVVSYNRPVYDNIQCEKSPEIYISGINRDESNMLRNSSLNSEFLAMFNDADNSSGKKSWKTSLFSNNYATGPSDTKFLKNSLAYVQNSDAKGLKKNMLLSSDKKYADSGSNENVNPDVDYGLPRSFGIMVDKQIFKRLSVGSGIIYTYLKSARLAISQFGYKSSQDIHYVGIPLSLSYKFIPSNDKWDVYATCGLLAEKPVKVKYNTLVYSYNTQVISEDKRDITIKETMLSANLGCGVSYGIFNHVDLFLEPNLTYIIYDKGQPVSYKTRNIWGFNGRVGLRFSL